MKKEKIPVFVGVFSIFLSCHSAVLADEDFGTSAVPLKTEKHKNDQNKNTHVQRKKLTSLERKQGDEKIHSELNPQPFPPPRPPDPDERNR